MRERLLTLTVRQHSVRQAYELIKLLRISHRQTDKCSGVDETHCATRKVGHIWVKECRSDSKTTAILNFYLHF